MSIEDIKHRARSVLLGDGKLMGDFYCDKETDEFIEHAPADIEFLLEQNQRLVEALELVRDKSQILASHCAVQLDRGGNVGSAYAFEKSQEIYELLRDKLLEKDI